MAGFSYGPQGQIMSSGEAAGRNTSAIMQGWVDRGPWQYWDTVTGAPNVALNPTYRPFSVAIGQQNPLTDNTKNKLETNLPGQGGSFPPPRCLLLMQIGFYFSSRMLKSDIDLVLDNCWMEFRIDDKIFHEGQLWQFPGGVGLMGVTTQTGESVYTLGLPVPVATRRYQDWSKYIAPLQLFSMLITFQGTPPTMSADGPGLYMVTFMDGLTDRSVQ